MNGRYEIVGLGRQEAEQLMLARESGRASQTFRIEPNELDWF
jgi:hypothetical protein